MVDLLDKAKERLGSYEKVAEYLGVRRPGLYDYRRHGLPAWVAGKLAKLVEEDEDRAIIEALMAQEKKESAREYWEEKIKRIDHSGEKRL